MEKKEGKKTTKPKKRGRPPEDGRKKLEVRTIVRTALLLIDRNGVSGFTMRGLALELNVDPMAIYHYVPDKQSLLRILADDLFEKLPLKEDLDWKKQIRNFARSYSDLVSKHPNFAYQLLINPVESKPLSRANEFLLDALRAGGIAEKKRRICSHTIVDYLNGFALAGLSPGIAVKAMEESLEIIFSGIEQLYISA